MSCDDQSPNRTSADEQDFGQGLELSRADRETIDRIFESDPESFLAESDRDHAVLNLLNLLDAPVASELQRATRLDLIQLLAARLKSSPGAEPELSPADRRALDQYIDNGYDATRVDPELEPRAAKCDQIGKVITASDQGGGAELVDKTLAAIQAHIDQEEAAMAVSSRSGRGSFSIRWSDLISIAATLLLVASVAIPVMSGMRSKAQKSLCFENMHAAANAFGLYAGSNRDMLPMATAGFGPTWMDVGSTPDRSNSSNLFTLVRTNNADLDDLACPSNPNAATGDMEPGAWDWNSLAEVSYSYRIMPPGGMRASAIAQPVGVVLLADRSPVVLRVARRQPVIPEENSPNHRGKGQHMLMLDGSSEWTQSPVLENSDNIWLPRPIEQIIHQARSKLGIIKGSELPDGPTDAFVGP